MTDDEITLRLLEMAEAGDAFCLHDDAIHPRFGDRGDGPRARQLAWDLIREGIYGPVRYDFDSKYIIPTAHDLDNDVPPAIPQWADQLMHDGALRFAGLYPKGRTLVNRLRARRWVGDVRNLPGHVRFASGDPAGEALEITLRDGRVHRGASAVAPERDGFLLTTSAGSGTSYYASPDPSLVWIDYVEVAEARCGGDARWLPKA